MQIHEMKVWHTYDKSTWLKGEWQVEPDKAHWIDKESNLDCLIVRTPAPLGHLCGYVGVTEGHPLFCKDYNNLDISVHGGLTFADSCQVVADESKDICHIPRKGRKADVWWFGFDCAHSGDRSNLCLVIDSVFDFGGYYKNFEYVKREVEDLAMQLKKYQRK